MGIGAVPEREDAKQSGAGAVSLVGVNLRRAKRKAAMAQDSTYPLCRRWSPVVWVVLSLGSPKRLSTNARVSVIQVNLAPEKRARSSIQAEQRL